jgi:Outer membrane lipoprotein-sorting protein
MKTFGTRTEVWGTAWSIVISMVILAVPVQGSMTFDLSTLPDDPEQRAKAIMEYMDDLWRGVSSRARMTMKVKTEHWSRTMTMDAWSLEKDYSLVRILSPKKEAGTSTLKFEKTIYNYLPKTDRTIKITSGMMMSSWMGSHFTNDDLVKESSFSDDYTTTIIFEGKRENLDVWDVELVPKPEAPVVWGKILFEIRQDNLMPLFSKYYDEAGELVRVMTFSDFKEMGGRLLPAVMRLVPKDSPGEFTEMIYEDIEFDIGLKKPFFSLRNLKKSK